MGMLFGTRRALLGGKGKFIPSDIPQSEADALVALYNATTGPSWTQNTNWLVDPVVNNWFGITVAGGHVTVVDLDANNLVGSVAGFQIGDLPNATSFFLYSNAGVTGDVGGWVLPASLSNFRMQDTSISGDVGGWVLPAGLLAFLIQGTSISGDISGWVLPALLVSFRIYGTGVTGTPDVTSSVVLQAYYYYDCALAQADVDAVLLSVYNRRMAFTYATPALNVGGTNAAPTGVYQAQCPPTTGKERAFELVNDSCGDGFNRWTVTFTP